MGNNENGIVKFLKKNVSLIVVAIISIFYIFWGSVELQFKNLNWWELICYISTTLVFGLSIASLIGETGFTAGKTDEKYINTRSTLIDWCNVAIEYKEEAIEYVNQQIDNEIKEERKVILNRAGIKYDEIFDENGKVLFSSEFLKETKKYTKKQKKSVKQALKLKKYDFTLFAYSPTKVIGRKKEQSESDYRTKSISKDFITRIFLAVVSGSVMFIFNGFDIATVIYAVFQMVLWIGSGVMKRIQNYNFIVVNQRDADLDRISFLKSFMATKGIIGEYDETGRKLVLVNTHKNKDNNNVITNPNKIE